VPAGAVIRGCVSAPSPPYWTPPPAPPGICPCPAPKATPGRPPGDPRATPGRSPGDLGLWPILGGIPTQSDPRRPKQYPSKFSRHPAVHKAREVRRKNQKSFVLVSCTSSFLHKDFSFF